MANKADLKVFNVSNKKEFEEKYNVSYDEFVNFMIYNDHPNSHVLLDIFLKNKEKFDYVGITDWHNKGCYGDKVRIGVIDSEWNVSNSYLKDKVSLRSETYGDDYDDENPHGFRSTSVVNIIAPKAEFVLFPANIFSFHDLADYDLDLVTMSMGSETDSMGKYDDYDYIKDKHFFLAAGGNDNYNHLSFPAESDGTTAVGAADLINGLPKRMDYSNKGDRLNVMGFTNITIPHIFDGTSQHTGTSSACPFVAGQLALVIGKLKEKGIKPTTDFLIDYINNNCEDMDESGFDEKTGDGLFVLPKI